MSSNPAGWHPDPYGRHASRYWDGERWTEHVSDGGGTSVDQPPDPAPAATEAPTTGQETRTVPAWSPTPGPSAGVPSWSGPAWSSTTSAPSTAARVPAVAALVGALVLVVSAFLPWFSIDLTGPVASFSEDVSGTDGSDGTVIIVLGIIAAAMAVPVLLGKAPVPLGVGLVVIGLLAIIVGLLNLGDDDVDQFNESLGGLAELSPSYGLWLVILAGVVVGAAGVLAAVLGRSTTA